MTPAELHVWVRTRWVELLDTARAAATRGPWVGSASIAVRPRVWYIEALHGGDIGQFAAATDANHATTFDPILTIAMCEAALERLDRHWAHVAFCPGCDRPTPCPDFLSDALPFRTRPDYPEELNR